MKENLFTVWQQLKILIERYQFILCKKNRIKLFGVAKDQGIDMAPPNELSLDWDQTISKNKKLISKPNTAKKKFLNKKVQLKTDSTVIGLYHGDVMSTKYGEETTGMETISNIMPLCKRKKGKNYGSK